jgi:NAD(P)H-hydrate epimerase
LTDVALTYLKEPTTATAAVFCGAGNNGGDGVACARMLKEAGVQVRTFLVGKREKMTPDARANEKRLLACGGSLEQFNPQDGDQKSFTENADLLIDAIFGIGLHRDLAGDAVAAVEWMNDALAPVIAADIPSGVQADTGCILGCAVKAAATVTFTMAKPGHIVGDGGLCTGKLYVKGIGLDPKLVNRLEYPVTILEEEMVRNMLPERPCDGHKGVFGKVFLLAGSKNYTGAPIMASRTAVRGGTGLVYLGVPEEIYNIIAIKCVEEMPVALASQDGSLAPEAGEEVLRRLADVQAALIGPGLSQSPGVEQVVRRALWVANCPIVLDADGINAIAGHIDSLDSRDGVTILTPHDGEYQRLTGSWPEKDRLGTALAFAKTHHCVLVMKGHRTIVAGPDGRAYLNTTGNDGMAKGGSGDVLGGLIVSLLGQGMAPLEAAAAAVWIHGRAGDRMAERHGRRGMTSTNVMMEGIPAVLKELE